MPEQTLTRESRARADTRLPRAPRLYLLGVGLSGVLAAFGKQVSALWLQQKSRCVGKAGREQGCQHTDLRCTGVRTGRLWEPGGAERLSWTPRSPRAKPSSCA